mgnify:FL=1
MIPRFTNLFRMPRTSFRAWYLSDVRQNSGFGSVSFDDDKFEAVVDVEQYQSGDINVEVMDSTIIIQARQIDKQGDHQLVSSQFIKKFILSKGYYDMNNVESTLYSDGVLIVTVPRNRTVDECCRKIPIVQAGKPYRS